MRITAADYEPLKAFFGAMIDRVLPDAAFLPTDQRPLAVLAAFEARSAAIARKSLAMGVADMVEMCFGLSPVQVAAIDAELEAQGIPTLTTVRARFSSRIRRILEKGKIRGEVDYHALRNVVEALPEEEQSQAWQILASFEARMAGKAQ
jgi:hypothetical protein